MDNNDITTSLHTKDAALIKALCYGRVRSSVVKLEREMFLQEIGRAFFRLQSKFEPSTDITTIQLDACALMIQDASILSELRSIIPSPDQAALVMQDEQTIQATIASVGEHIRNVEFRRGVDEILNKSKKDEGAARISNAFNNSPITENLVFQFDDNLVAKLDVFQKVSIHSSIMKLNDLSERDGYESGDVVLFAAPTGAGKTSWMINEAIHIAKQEFRIMHITLGEMQTMDVLDKFLSNLANTSLRETISRRKELYGQHKHVLDRISFVNTTGEKESQVDIKYVIQLLERNVDAYDIVMIDYDGKFSNPNNQPVYQYDATNHKEIRRFIDKSKKICIIASQARWEKRIPNMDINLIRGGKIKNEIANIVLMLQRFPDTYQGILRCLKCRNGVPFDVGVSYDQNSRFSYYKDVESIPGISDDEPTII